MRSYEMSTKLQRYKEQGGDDLNVDNERPYMVTIKVDPRLLA